MSKVKQEVKSPSKNAELLENPDALANRIFDTEKFVRRNRNILIGIVAAIIVVVGGYLLYSYWGSQQDQEANEQMFAAEHYWGTDSTRLALKGDGNYPGFEAIMKDYPMSQSANLAHFYAGVAYMKDQKFEKAVEELKQFDAGDYLVQGRTFCLLGDAHMELKKYEAAITYYNRAATYYPNEEFTPTYLMKLALAYERQKQYKEAIDTYDKVITEYFKSSELANAKKYKARLEAMTEK
jgi:tetratricopeptide (TPR) repeat protein